MSHVSGKELKLLPWRLGTVQHFEKGYIGPDFHVTNEEVGEQTLSDFFSG